MFNSDIKILEVVPTFSPVKGRTPLKFGDVVINELTYVEVRVKVENRKGRIADGYGGIFLSDLWAFPTPDISHEQKDKAMRVITEKFCKLVCEHKRFAHPIEIFVEMEHELKKINKNIPYLATLVSVSPVDAAIHDAFGVVNKIDTYDGYGKEFMNDLSRFLGNGFKNKYISDYIRKKYLSRIPVFHLVGGLDKLRESEVNVSDPKDGLPNSLEKWVERDGLFCLKVKLRGRDLGWDVNRYCDVVKITHNINKKNKKFYFSIDTNEQCESPEYIMEFLAKVKERNKIAFKELFYIEQPTERDLMRHKFNMKKLSKIKPVMIDESLMDLNDYELARELGWNGVALKTCKCQSAELLFLSKATEDGLHYTVQDLTNPKLSLIHSVGFASRTYTMNGVEANSYQFFPTISNMESRVHPGIFKRQNGMLDISTLNGHGLGYHIEKIIR